MLHVLHQGVETHWLQLVHSWSQLVCTICCSESRVRRCFLAVFPTGQDAGSIDEKFASKLSLPNSHGIFKKRNYINTMG